VGPIALPTRRSTIRLARGLAAALQPGDLVILKGGLGAGKTFFARAVCRALGVPPGVPVTSPTFTLVHEHQGRLRIAHADVYRLPDAGDLPELGLDELRREGAVLLVEWLDVFPGVLGGDGLTVELRPFAGSKGREAILHASGPRSRALAEAMTEAAARAALRGKSRT
jgi:tRNA threonylcarbamoyladenosine biosynthesis protein TsaE